MNPFELSNEQTMYQDSLRKLLETEAPFAKRLTRIANKQYIDNTLWATISNLGVCSVLVDEQHGGLGGSVADCAAIMEQVGASLCLEPILLCSLANAIVNDYGSVHAKTHLLPSALQGNVRIVPAIWNDQGPISLDTAHRSIQATHDKNGYRLHGTWIEIEALSHATHVIVKAICDSTHRAIYAICPVDQVKSTHYTRIDDKTLSDITLTNVHIANDFILHIDHDTLLEDALLPLLTACLTAEALGIMTYMNEATRAYTKQREQFGRPISTFQALQHRMVEMFLQEEQARSLRFALPHAIDQRQKISSEQLQTLTKQTLMLIEAYAKCIGEETVQLHGAMGVSDELDISHYFRRLTCIRVHMHALSMRSRQQALTSR